MRFILIFSLFLLALPSQAVDITKVKAGLVCMNPAADGKPEGWVCHETRDILVTDQGRCTYNGASRHCSWYGFSFDYRADTDRTVLHCVAENSRPTSPGNPRGIIAENVTSSTFDIPLEGKQGHFFNPMYYVFAVREPDDAVVVDTMTCSHEGVVVFRNTFNLHLPMAPERTP